MAKFEKYKMLKTVFLEGFYYDRQLLSLESFFSLVVTKAIFKNCSASIGSQIRGQLEQARRREEEGVVERGKREVSCGRIG